MPTPSSPVEAWLALSLTPGLTPAAQRRLVAKLGPPEGFLARSAAHLAHSVGDTVAQAIARGPDRARLQATLAWAKTPGCRVVAFDDPAYPCLLREIGDPPLVLYARGRVELLQQPAIAVVGSRSASTQGSRNAAEFARALSQAGLCIVSGLAQGIDAAAHQGGLEGPGSSIAVLGTGIDRVYPARHRSLATQLSEEGLLLTEFPLGTPPVPGNFPRRNRIISGLARGCLVVEAALASGSLITARMAADQGRDVLAIPGSIHAPLSKGCHHLLKQGAKLVECAQDVLEELGEGWHPAPASPGREQDSMVSTDARLVLDAMAHDPCDMDALASQIAMPVERVGALLLELELAGLIESLPGGRVQRVR